MSVASALGLSPESLSEPVNEIADELCAANEWLLGGRRQWHGRHLLPSRRAVADLMDDLRGALFPGHFAAPDLPATDIRSYVEAQLNKVQVALVEQIRRGLSMVCEHAGFTAGNCPGCNREAAAVADGLLARLPAIRRLLEADLRAAYASDPAARILDETLYCYPGVLAIMNHRVAHELHQRSVPFIPRMISALSHAATGIDIHPGAKIGPHFFIDHGTGVVIGETCEIGARVRLYQGVTLGSRDLAIDPDGFVAKGQPRHPILRDDVVVYAGATILGRVTIGEGATIGGNVWLTRDVAPGALVTQAFLEHNVFEDGSGI